MIYERMITCNSDAAKKVGARRGSLVQTFRGIRIQANCKCNLLVQSMPMKDFNKTKNIRIQILTINQGTTNIVHVYIPNVIGFQPNPDADPLPTLSPRSSLVGVDPLNV